MNLSKSLGSFSRIALILAIGLFSLTAAAYSQPLGPYEKRVPLIYGTDLFHPHDDPDDHLDLANLFAIPEIDVKGIILDLGLRQQKKPGKVPVEQMIALTGRRFPYAIGLAEQLKDPDDKGLNQPQEFQGGAELLLKILRESDQPVNMLFAGSVRDLAAAYNRDPNLLRQKTSSIHINIGNSQVGGTEWNVTLDPQAYRKVMSSGLPIYWYPCLPMVNEWSAHWRLERYGDVMASAPLRLQNFFLYMLHQVDTVEIDPLEALKMDLRPWRKLLWNKPKGMWCTASLIQVAGRKILKAGDGGTMGGEGHQDWVAVPPSYQGDKKEEVAFSFVPTSVELHPDGKTAKIDRNVHSSNTKVIHVPNPELYARIMTCCLLNLYQDFTGQWPIPTASEKR